MLKPAMRQNRLHNNAGMDIASSVGDSANAVCCYVIAK